MKFKEYYAEQNTLMQKLPLFLMPIGIPGSGKSRFIRSLNASFHIESSDNIRKKLTGNVSDISRDKEVFEIAHKNISASLREGKHAALDATNVDHKRRKEFLEGLPPHRRRFKLIEADPKVAKERIKKDLEDGKDRSNVPDRVVDTSFKKLQEGLKHLEKEGFKPFNKNEA